MNSRERILAVAISSMLVLGALYYLFDSLEQGFHTRRQAIAKLEQQKLDLERRVRSGKQARTRWVEYRDRSLPADRELARSLYQKWLLKEVESVGMSNVTINGVPTTSRGDAVHVHAFKVTCKGNIEQLTKWLHSFYSTDMLHRLRQLTIKPQNDSKLLDLTISLEAASLIDADQQELPTTPSKRLQREGLAPYVAAIVGRNVFAPANQPPKLASLGTQRGAPRRALNFSAKAEDSDKLDKVTFRLVDPPLAGAKIDATTGAFQWTPADKGEFEVTIEATDDGFPAKAVTQKVRLVVADPPPPPPEPVAAKPTKRKLDFDPARHTILTGIIGNDDRREIWLTVRTTGEIQKLHAGDKVNIGSIEGEVGEIGENAFELINEGKHLQVNLGEHLLQAREIVANASPERD